MIKSTITIVTQHGLTVCLLPEFLSICPDPSKFDEYQLSEEYNIEKYVHNEEGPAVVGSPQGPTFWLNGVYYEKEDDWKQAVHNVQFNDKLEKTLEE